MSKKTITLSRNERIIAVVPECASGPGWSNHLAWVYVANYVTCEFRQVAIQVDEMTPELLALHAAGAAMCESLIRAVPTRKEA